ncbi:serine/threonine-protein kinase [Georgenia alba]|uniref:non-specific serine/threonine protein kinase n=1 Tax=Georgenia alba TaxID=2233858 RepID=A0ABW2Q9T7_9MICO
MTSDLLLGRYELGRLLGRGGMAEVWEARDTRLGRRVAVKTVNLAAAHDPTLGERLQREARAVASLKHTDIVTVYDAGLEDDTAYLVMELVDGTDLATTLREGPLPPGEAARVGARVAGALAAAHGAGVVHRDVKPGNVLLHGDDVTVVDFGIAVATQAAGATLTAPGTVIGTADYMAPEQAEGGEVTAATDVYALGCLVTAMTVGRPPFAGDHPMQVVRQHLDATAPRLSAAMPDVPRELDDVVARMLAKDPTARPSLEEVRRTLERVATDASGVGATAAVGTPDAEATAAMASASTAAMPAGGTTAVMPDGTTVAMPAGGTAVMPAGAEPPTETSSEAAGPRRRWFLAVAVAAALLVAVIAVAQLSGNGQEPAAGGPTAEETAPDRVETTEPETDPEAATTPPQEDPGPEGPGGEGPGGGPGRAGEGGPGGGRQGEGNAGHGNAGRGNAGRGNAEAPDDDMGQLISSLGLEPDVERDLLRKWEEVLKAVDEGKEDKVEDRTEDFGDRVDELEGEGRISEDQAEALQDGLDSAFGD